MESIENAKKVVKLAKRATGIEKRSTRGRRITCVEGKRDMVVVKYSCEEKVLYKKMELKKKLTGYRNHVFMILRREEDFEAIIMKSGGCCERPCGTRRIACERGTSAQETVSAHILEQPAFSGLH
jgi:hypothetical protein